MIRQMSGIADRTNDRDPCSGAFFDRLRKRVVQIALLVIAARRNIDDAYVVFFAVLKHPFEAVLNISLGDPARSREFDQHDIGIRRDAAIKSVRKRTVSRGDDRSHHPVPACDVGLKQRAEIAVCVDQIAVGDDAVGRRGQIDVRVKSRIEKRDRHAFARKTLVGIEPQRRRKHVRTVFLHRRVLDNMVFCPFEQPNAACANRLEFPRVRGICPDQFLQVFVQGPAAGQILRAFRGNRPGKPCRRQQYRRSLSAFGIVKIRAWSLRGLSFPQRTVKIKESAEVCKASEKLCLAADVLDALNHVMTNKKIGLALSGGGARGFAHVGVLKALSAHSIPVDLVSGTSAGSFVGGAIAAGMSVEEIIEIGKKISWLSVAGFSYSPRGLLSNAAMGKLIEKNFPVNRFEDLKIPFAAVACDLETGDEVILA